jgi:hypothetical protein
VLPALVLLGLALRAYHFLRVPSVWHDEAALLMNVLTRDFGQLLGPLLWHEAAPPLFLWAERAAFLTLGDGVLALRLLPFLASCAALLLMVPVARALLPRPAVPWAVFLFAVSEQLAWHACEAKPYALDVFAATVLLTVCCVGRHSLTWRLTACAALAPVLVFLSYPACFVYGGVLVALLPGVWRERRTVTWAAYVGLAVSVVGSFGLLVLGPAKAQRDGAMMSCWLTFFPDWSRPWTLPAWLVRSTLGVCRYCCKPLGETLVPLAVVGAVACWRTGRRADVALLGLPVLLALAAACLQRYPYGGARVMVYAAPALVLLVAAGVPPVLAWLKARRRLAVVPLVALLALPLAGALRSVAFHWPRADVAGAADFVLDRRQPGDAVLGNDWTHFYYFRALGPLFQEDAASVSGSARVWVVYTEQASADERLRAARARVAGWRLLERRDFEFTTVLLLARPGLASGGREPPESAHSGG